MSEPMRTVPELAPESAIDDPEFTALEWLKEQGVDPDSWQDNDGMPTFRSEMPEGREAKVASAHPDAATGAMVALRVDDAENHAVPGGLEPHDMHVTLFFMGNTLELDPGVEAAMTNAVMEVVEEYGPLTLLGTHVAHMGPDDDPNTTVAVEIAGHEIHALREVFAASLRRFGVEWSTRWAFRPHMSLTYIPRAEAERDWPIGELDVPMVINASSVRVAWADRDWLVPFGIEPMAHVASLGEPPGEATPYHRSPIGTGATTGQATKVAAFNPNQPRCPIGTGQTAGRFSNEQLINCNPMVTQLSDRALLERIERISAELAGQITSRRRRRMEEELTIAQTEQDQRLMTGPREGVSDDPANRTEGSPDYYAVTEMQGQMSLGIRDPESMELSEDAIDRSANTLLEFGGADDPDQFMAENFDPSFTDAEREAIKARLTEILSFRDLTHDELLREMGTGDASAARELERQVVEAYATHGDRLADDGWQPDAGSQVTISQGSFAHERVDNALESIGMEPGYWSAADAGIIRQAYDTVLEDDELAELAEIWGHPYIMPINADSHALGVVIATPQDFPVEAKNGNGVTVLALREDIIVDLDEGADPIGGIPQDDRHSVDETVEGVLRHELVHWYEAQKSAQRIVDRYSDTDEFQNKAAGKAQLLRQQVSRYATTNFQEVFAELGTIYYSPHFVRDAWDPVLLDIMDSMDRWLEDDGKDDQ